MKKEMKLDIDKIQTNPFQPREYFDEGKLQILADSIKEHGLDTPIQILWREGKATLKDGERRLRALKMAGYKKLRYGKEYIIIEVKDDSELEYRGLIANCMREDLQPVEKGKAFLKILDRRGINTVDMAINSVNRAKDWIDNGFLAEPSTRNYFIPKATIELIAKDMKMVGISGTNAIDLIKITQLPKDIQKKIIVAPPNSKIIHEKMKLNRHGDMVERRGNDRGEFIPISFGRELIRLPTEKMIRFFLRTALEREWTVKKLAMMIDDYLASKLEPDDYIRVYTDLKQSVRAYQNRKEEIDHVTKSMDSMASTLTSWRNINLVALASPFKQKEFAISGKGLLSATSRLKTALEETLLTTSQLIKIKEEKKMLNVPFRVELASPPHQHRGFRFSIPADLSDKIDAEVGDTVEIMIVSIIKPRGR